MKYQAKPSCGIQRPSFGSWVNSCVCVRARDRLGIPEVSETRLENDTEGGGVNPHGGDEGPVFVILVEACPGCSNTWVREEVHPSEVLSTRTPVFYRPRMILVGTHNEDCSEKAHPVQEFCFLVDLKLVLGSGVVEEEEVVVHG